nr:tyrosine-type recombinase/integrase [Sphingomonas sp. KC8]
MSRALASAAAARTPVAGEVVTVLAPGEARLPRRMRGSATDRIAQLTSLLGELVAADCAIDALAFRKSLEARAPASVKALANDLACYAEFCTRVRGVGLPATVARVVAYVEHCEARQRKPATVNRRLASLAVMHDLLGVPSPTLAPVVRDAVRGMRRRVDIGQRQASPLRFGEGIGVEAATGFTLTALLDACPGTVSGLRDAALLSLGYDAGLRVSELVAVRCEHITIQEDGSARLKVPQSKTDQEGQGAWAWLSPDTVRRIAAWRAVASITTGSLLRRIGVLRTRVREARRAIHIAELAWNAGVDHRRMAAQPAKPATTTYAIGEEAMTPAAVRQIIKRTALRAAEEGLVALFGTELEAAIAGLSTHSLRVGLTQDLFASGEDAGPISQALRWSSTATALRYGRELAPSSNAAARMLRRVRR